MTEPNIQQPPTPSVAAACYTVERPWTWKDRLRARLFPMQHCFAPEAPGRFKDCISVQTITVMSWADRLRLLFTGVVVTHTRTVTENEVGDSKTASVCYVGTKRDLKGA